MLVLHSQVPFTRGGAEVLVEGLAGAIATHGHSVEIVALPYSWNPVDKLLTSSVAWGLLDLDSFNGVSVDRVICTKFPTWSVNHPRKSLWLIHQHRQAYDLHGTPLSEFSPDPESQQVRRHVREIDRRGITTCDKRFAISRNVASRLKRFNGLDAEALYPPVPLSGLQATAYDPFVLCVSRIDNAKRVDLAVDAVSKSTSGLRLVVAGSGPGLEALREKVARNNLADRVEVLGRVTDDELRDLYNRCRAVIYTPVDEDYGYAAVEALTAGKPVITADDSGGVLEFVSDGITGLVTLPAPADLALAIDRLADESFARDLGSNGPNLTRDLTWDRIVHSLLGTDSDS